MEMWTNSDLRSPSSLNCSSKAWCKAFHVKMCFHSHVQYIKLSFIWKVLHQASFQCGWNTFVWLPNCLLLCFRWSHAQVSISEIMELLWRFREKLIDSVVWKWERKKRLVSWERQKQFHWYHLDPLHGYTIFRITFKCQTFKGFNCTDPPNYF